MIPNEIVQHIADGEQREYKIPFKFLDSSELEVYAETGAYTTWTATGAGKDSGGTLTTDTVFARGSQIEIKRNASELMTVKETADCLRIPIPTVNYLVQRGQLPAIKISGQWHIRRSLLDVPVLTNNGGGEPTVLVVDDDPALRMLFTRFFKKAGFECVFVRTGAEAIADVEKREFDLVFLNLKLLDIQGDELCAKLKEIHPDLPIVITIGNPDSDILDKILADGPVTLIKKPIEFEQLNRLVKILGHKGVSTED